jgi:hypothetical protein
MTAPTTATETLDRTDGHWIRAICTARVALLRNSLSEEWIVTRACWDRRRANLLRAGWQTA